MLEVINIEQDPKGNYDTDAIITLRYTPNWFAKHILRRESWECDFYGSDGVWYYVSDGSPAPENYEYWFEGIWRIWIRENK